MIFKTIEEEWQGYAAMVFKGVTPSDVQREETKQAFFSGAWVILNALVAVGEDHVPEDFSVAYMQDRMNEIERFKRQIMAKYAERN